MDWNALVTAESFIAILQAEGITNLRLAHVLKALFLRDEILLAESRVRIANAAATAAQDEAAAEVASASGAKIEAELALDEFMQTRL